MTGRHRRPPRRRTGLFAVAALILVTAASGLAVARHGSPTQSGRDLTAARVGSAPMDGPGTTPLSTLVPAGPLADRSGSLGQGAGAVSRAAARVPALSVAPARSAYRVVGLGDSVPAGAACGCTPYVTLVGQAQAQAAGAGAGARIDDLASDGLTTADLIAQLDDSDTAAAVARADLVIVTVGANDFDESMASDPGCAPPDLSCYRSTLAEQAAQLDAVLGRIAALSTVSTHKVVVTGYWNVFLDGSVGQDRGDAYVATSAALTSAENAVIAAAADRAGDTYVDLYTPFKGTGSIDDTNLLADDGDHPDAAGHALIASTIESALR